MNTKQIAGTMDELTTALNNDSITENEFLEATVLPDRPATRTLDFTLVSGYLRGEHTCAFELHATGCRDLNKLKKLNLFSFNVYAESREAAHMKAVEELGGVAKPTDIWVQPCCTLKRMQAIGRA